MPFISRVELKKKAEEYQVLLCTPANELRLSLAPGPRCSAEPPQLRSGTATMPPPAIALEGVGQGTARRLTAEARTPPPPPAASSPWSKELRCGTTTDAPPVLDARPATSTDAIPVEATLEIKPSAP